MKSDRPQPLESTASLETESQTYRAVLQIRELLIRGDFKPGERIREVPLAEKLNVSRTPLRLALDRLEHEGLLEARPKGGFSAKEFSVQDILDAIELRGVLEGTAARLAAERLESKDELAAMIECVEATDKLLGKPARGVDLIGGYERLNSRFHGLLLDLAKSAMLRRAMERVLALPFASPNAFVASETESQDRREILLVSNSHHRAIADAILNREGTRAEAMAREHSRMMRRSLTLALQQHQFGRIPGGLLIKVPEAS